MVEMISEKGVRCILQFPADALSSPSALVIKLKKLAM